MKPRSLIMPAFFASVALGAIGFAALETVSLAQLPRSSGSDRCSVRGVSALLANDPAAHVITVRSFAKGQMLPPDDGSPAFAANDLCMIKLSVGAGTPGSTDAPTVQPRIGIEMWLPSPSNWTGRIHNVGGAAFMGLSEITDPDRRAPSVSNIASASSIAGTEGAVSAITDTGHSTPGSDNEAYTDGSFLLAPDGTPNRAQWAAFSEISIHEAAVRTKQIVRGYYGRDAAHAYFEGCSTGGRQAHKYAQRFPADYDGIVAGAPGINWTRFLTSDMYFQVAMERAFGGPISPAKLGRISSAAVSACDAHLSGRHDGFISDPMSCAYDPTRDKALLCRADGGTNATSSCITAAEARVVNSLWYGQTADGRSANPATLAGLSDKLNPGQLWFGLTRGTDLRAIAGSKDGKGTPFAPAAHMVAFELRRNAIATPNLKNAAGNGADAWQSLTLSQMVEASRQGGLMKEAFARIDTDEADLSDFKRRGGRMIVYHGLADQIVPPQGSLHYYRAVERAMGGRNAVDSFYRLFTVPGMGHCAGVGSVNGVSGISPRADPPLPRSGQFYGALLSWVEHGQEPGKLIVQDAQGKVSRPLCHFPSRIRYVRGDITKASSFRCEG